MLLLIESFLSRCLSTIIGICIIVYVCLLYCLSVCQFLCHFVYYVLHGVRKAIIGLEEHPIAFPHFGSIPLYQAKLWFPIHIVNSCNRKTMYSCCCKEMFHYTRTFFSIPGANQISYLCTLF